MGDVSLSGIPLENSGVRALDADLYGAELQGADAENIASTGNLNIGNVLQYDEHVRRHMEGGAVGGDHRLGNVENSSAIKEDHLTQTMPNIQDNPLTPAAVADGIMRSENFANNNSGVSSLDNAPIQNTILPLGRSDASSMTFQGFQGMAAGPLGNNSSSNTQITNIINETGGDTVNNVINNVSEILAPVTNTINDITNIAGDVLAPVTDTINDITNIAGDVLAPVTNTINDITNIAGDVLAPVTDTINDITNIAGDVLAPVTDTINDITNIAGDVLAPVTDTINDITNIAGDVLAPVTNTVNDITNIAGDVLAPVTDTINDITNIAGDVLAPVTNTINDITNIAGDVLAPVTNTINDITNIAGDVLAPVTNTINDITNIAGDVLAPVTDISSTATDVVTDVTNVVEPLVGDILNNGLPLIENDGHPLVDVNASGLAQNFQAADDHALINADIGFGNQADSTPAAAEVGLVDIDTSVLSMPGESGATDGLSVAVNANTVTNNLISSEENNLPVINVDIPLPTATVVPLLPPILETITNTSTTVSQPVAEIHDPVVSLPVLNDTHNTVVAVDTGVLFAGLNTIVGGTQTAPPPPVPETHTHSGVHSIVHGLLH